MWFRQFLINLIKRLPFILSIVLTPALFIWIVYYNPSVLELFRFSSSSGDEQHAEDEAGNDESLIDKTQIDHSQSSEYERPDSMLIFGRDTGDDGSHDAELSDIGSSEADESGDMGEGSSLTKSLRTKSRYIRELEERKGKTPASLTKIDWEAEATKITDAESFFQLAEKADVRKREDLKLQYLLKALDLDPGHAETKKALSALRFDPEKHLPDFASFQGQQMEGFLQTFKDRGIRNQELTTSRLRELCASWEPVRARLHAELKARESDPFETRRKTHLLRLQSLNRIRHMRYAVCRVHEPFRIFIEEDLLQNEMPGAFSEPLARDLYHAISEFEKRYIFPDKRSDKAGHVFFVWLLREKKTFSVEFDPAYRMLKVELPDSKKPDRLSEADRRRITEQFAYMLIDSHSDGSGANKGHKDQGMKVWLQEGITFLFNQGVGLDDAGNLILHEPFETQEPALFPQWIELSGLVWPIPLERLIEFSDPAALKSACNVKLFEDYPDLRTIGLLKVFGGALEASRLFCLYAYQENDADAFFEYARMRLAGREPEGPINDWLKTRNWPEIENEMIRRFASAEVESKAISNKTIPQEEIVPPKKFDGLEKLLKPGIDATSFRSLVIRLVREHGYFEAHGRLTKGLQTAGLDAASPIIAQDLALLEDGIRIEEAMLNRLAEARVPLSIDDEDRILIQADKGKIRCETETGEATAELPATVVAPSRWIYLSKNKLKLKTDGDRLDYGLLYLLNGDIVNFKKEMKFIKGSNERKEALEKRMSGFTVSAAGADAIEALGKADEKTDLDAFVDTLLDLEGTPLLDLLMPDVKPFLKSCLTHQCMAPDDNGYLAKTFAGYVAAESDSDSAVFRYAFGDAQELDDFEREPPPFFTMLGPNESPYSDSRPFDFREGRLTSYGTGFLILKPVFAGPVVLKASFEYLDMDGDPGGVPPALHLGYGLGAGSGVISASNFFFLCTQKKIGGGLKRFDGRKIYSHIMPNRTYSIVLDGKPDEIRVTLDETELLAVDLPGHRVGKVFVQSHFPLGVWLKSLEVRAEIDPVRLREEADTMVEKKLADILSRLP